MKRFILSLAVGSMVLSLVLVNGVWADSTIGANMSTTGTLTVNNNSGTAVRFQRSSTNIFIFDTTNGRLGIDSGGALDTKFEVGGTASAQNFLAQGAVQFAGNASSVAYSRFGTSTTKRGNYVTASNDLLVSGDLETVGSAAFGGTASVSGIFFMTDGQHRPSANSTTAFRFQNAAGSTNVLTIDTTNTRVGVGGIGGALDTKFEVGGTASATNLIISGAVQFASNAASVAYSRFGSTATTHTNYISASNDLLVSGDAEVRGSVSFATTASVGTNFNVGENSAATTSATFETRSATQGACFVITDNAGTVKYARINSSTNAWIINTVACN